MSFLRVKVTPVTFKDKIDTLRAYGITGDFNISRIYSIKYLLIDTEDKDIKYILDSREVFSTEDIIDAKEDFFLLSDEVQKKAFENSDGDIISLLKNTIINWFSWGYSPEGYKFWHNWEKTIKQRLSEEIKVSKEFDEWITSNPNVDLSGYKTVSTKVDNSSFKTISDIKCNDTFWIGYHNDYEIQQKLYNLLKREEDESRLQKQEDPLRRGDSGKPVKLHTGKHKARVAVQHPGYKKIIGRG